ncbi:MAG: hypothetical protein WCO06_03970 [Candidatus Roizmanbacteria bacterium]
MGKLLRSLQWLDENILKILVSIFIFLIPLFPKFPLIDLEFTYLNIRLEDFFMVLVGLVFAVQVIRKKETINKEFFWLFIVYWIAIFSSLIWNYFISKEIEYLHIGLLHTARRVEYMLIFFVTISSIKSKKDLFFYLTLIFEVLLIACTYGLGQKFGTYVGLGTMAFILLGTIGWIIKFGMSPLMYLRFTWLAILGYLIKMVVERYGPVTLPAIQTMNPEFSRGLLLFLTKEARVSSTFAGHYDFAAYLVFLIPILIAFIIYRKNISIMILFVISLFMLVLTASRVSFGAYAVSVTGLLLWSRKWMVLISIVILTILLNLFSSGLVQRFVETFQIRPIFVNSTTGQMVVAQKVTTKQLPGGSIVIPGTTETKMTTQEMTNGQKLLIEQVRQDLRNEASKSGKILSATEEAQMVATITAGLSGQNAMVLDTSMAVRFQVSWPRAFKAFKSNPILGTGASSLTEATDGGYVRTIGEFGLFGTLAFFAIILKMIWIIWIKLRTDLKHKQEGIIYYGFLFGILAILINTTLIDVFEASKVAFYFWMISGIMIGSLLIEDHKSSHNKHHINKREHK